MTKFLNYLCPLCGKEHSKFTDRCPETREEVAKEFRLDGSTIDAKYRVDRKVGYGGMGVVYEGTHLAIGRKIAIKFLSSSLKTNEKIIIRFQNEARLAASIGHRNIVDVIDMGLFQGELFYIVMEYLYGQDLATMLQYRRRLPGREAVDYTIQILDGLNAAHAKGIIHRDLKPENIFIVSQFGGAKYVKILDFGVSRLIDSEKGDNPNLTKPGMIFGTPRYMSPEQARGRASVDQRSDLYSVGAMLYEMLCGSPMFTAEGSNEVIAEVLTMDPPHVLKRNPQVQFELAGVVMKAVARKPEERFQSAQEFIGALAPYGTAIVLRQQPPAAPQPGADERQALHARKVGDTELLQAEGEEPPTGASGAGVAADDLNIEESAMKAAMIRSTLPPMEGRRRVPGRRVWISLSILAAAAFIAVGLVWAVRYMKASRESAERDPQAGSPAGKRAGENLSKVVIENLPPGAKVYIDDVYYPEHPIEVTSDTIPRRLKVVVEGGVLMNEKVMIFRDVVIPFVRSGTAAAGGKPVEVGKPSAADSGTAQQAEAKNVPAKSNKGVKAKKDGKAEGLSKKAAEAGPKTKGKAKGKEIDDVFPE